MKMIFSAGAWAKFEFYKKNIKDDFFTLCVFNNGYIDDIVLIPNKFDLVETYLVQRIADNENITANTLGSTWRVILYSSKSNLVEAFINRAKVTAAFSDVSWIFYSGESETSGKANIVFSIPGMDTLSCLNVLRDINWSILVQGFDFIKWHRQLETYLKFMEEHTETATVNEQNTFTVENVEFAPLESERTVRTFDRAYYDRLLLQMARDELDDDERVLDEKHSCKRLRPRRLVPDINGRS